MRRGSRRARRWPATNLADGEALGIEPLSDAEILASFEPSFEAARRRFASLCAAMDLETSEHAIDGSGDTLFVAHFGNRESACKLVVLSGVHGVEGFAGSAAQIAFLRHRRRARPRVHVLLAHVVNPYGMRRFRRTTADNVDLNRNLVSDYDARARADPAARALGRPISSRRLARLPDPLWITWLALRVAALGGPRKLKEVLAGGQFFDRQGLFYGGAARAPEIDALFSALGAWLGEAEPEKVIFFDLHSGIGAFGHCMLLANGGSAERAGRIFDTPIEQGHGEAGVFAVDGELMRGLKTGFGMPEACAVTFECGTGAALGTFLALRYANSVQHHFADDPVRTARARARMLRAFCPRSERWRTTYVRSAIHFLDRALRHLSDREPAYV